MRTIHRILIRLSAVLGLVAAVALVVAVIANHEALLGTGVYAPKLPFDLKTARPVDPPLPYPPSGLKEDKAGNVVTYEIPIDKAKTSWHDAALAGCKAAADSSESKWCDYRDDPIPDLATFNYCIAPSAPAWCHGVEKIKPDSRVPTADMPNIDWQPTEADFKDARENALMKALFPAGLIGLAALGVLTLAWILKPEGQ